MSAPPGVFVVPRVLSIHRMQQYVLCSHALALVVLLGAVTPHLAFAQGDRGACLSGSGASGASACQRAIASDPNDAQLHVALVDRLLESAKIQDANTALTQALARFPQDNALRERTALVQSHLAEQKFMQERNRARNKGGKRTAVAKRRDDIKCRKRTGEEALDSCQRLIGDNANNSKALSRAAFLLAQLGRGSQARQMLVAARKAGASAASLSSTQRLITSIANSGGASARVKAAKVKKTTPRPGTPARTVAPLERRLAFNAQTGEFTLR